MNFAVLLVHFLHNALKAYPPIDSLAARLRISETSDLNTAGALHVRVWQLDISEALDLLWI